MLYIVATLFVLIGAALVASIILSVPGGWIMLGLALVIEALDGLYLAEGRERTFDWWVLGVSAGLLALGELLEFAAGAAGAKHGGAGKRGVIGALVGGIAGAILATFMIPIPIVGTLIGAIIGTFLGAVIGEVTGAQPKTVRGSMKPAIGATIGRVLGTFGKMATAIVAWIALSVAAFWT